MHYRVRGNNIQLIKTVTGESGKAKSTPVGSANLMTGKINSKAQESLDENEKNEVEAWLKARKALNKKDLEVKIELLPDTLSTLSDAMKKGDLVLSESLSKSLVREINLMRRIITVKPS